MNVVQVSGRRRNRNRYGRKTMYTVGIVVPLDLYALVNEEAKNRRISVSAMLNPVLQDFLKQAKTVIKA